MKLYIPLAFALTWGFGIADATDEDTIVTQTVTNTWYTCPCDAQTTSTTQSPDWYSWTLASATSQVSTTTAPLKTLSSSSTIAPTTTSAPVCPFSVCQDATSFPSTVLPEALSLCSSLLTTTLPTTTIISYVTTTETLTYVPSLSKTTSYVTTITTVTDSISCTGSATVTIPLVTFVGYTSRGAGPNVKRRGISLINTSSTTSTTSSTSSGSTTTAMLITSTTSTSTAGSTTTGSTSVAIGPGISSLCPGIASSVLSRGCSCLVTAKIITPSVTSTSTITMSTTLVHTTPTTVISSITTVTQTDTTCTLTINPTVTNGNCGLALASKPTASTSGTISCANTVPAPSSNVRFRIEGNDSEGTTFEDCIVSGPRVITTPSGGSHQCDGTNNGANPAPANTPTDLIDAAGKRDGFDFDGTFSSQFDDFFITRIRGSAQTSNQFWGVLNNYQFTPTGGCQFEVQNGDLSLWAYDAFNKNAFLKVSPDYAIVQAGQGTFSVTVTDGMNNSPVGGASFAGGTSSADGLVTVPVPTVPGCYQYKATKSGALRSNAFYLNVVASFAA